MEIGLRVVGSQHDDDQIKRQVAREGRGQVCAAVEPREL